MEAPSVETQLEANSFGSLVPVPHHPQILCWDALSATTLPICPGLGQAQEYVYTRGFVTFQCKPLI